MTLCNHGVHCHPVSVCLPQAMCSIKNSECMELVSGTGYLGLSYNVLKGNLSISQNQSLNLADLSALSPRHVNHHECSQLSSIITIVCHTARSTLFAKHLPWHNVSCTFVCDSCVFTSYNMILQLTGWRSPYTLLLYVIHPVFIVMGVSDHTSLGASPSVIGYGSLRRVPKFTSESSMCDW